VIAAMRVAGGPYAVARQSLTLALERLRAGEAEMQAYVARARDQVARLSALLTRHGVSVPASQASFVLLVGPKVPALAAALAKRGIGTRAFPHDPRLADARRMVVPGDEGVFRRLETALTEAFAEIA
jgi:cobalamin biosynthetic protein CobC